MPTPRVYKYSQLPPNVKANLDAMSPEERQAYATSKGVVIEDDSQPQQEFNPPSIAGAMKPSEPVPMDFGGIGQDIMSMARAVPRTAAGAMSGAVGMSRVPGIGQTPMGLGAGALMGAVSGAFGPEVNTPEGFAANLMNMALPGAQARAKLPNNVIGSFLNNLLAMKTGDATEKAVKTMWPGAQQPQESLGESLMPSKEQLGFSAIGAAVPPLWRRIIDGANTPQKMSMLQQFMQHFQDLDIPAAERAAAMQEIDRRLGANSQQRLAEGQVRMANARSANEPVLGPRVTPAQEAALPPSDVQVQGGDDLMKLLGDSVKQAEAAKAVGQKPQFQARPVAQPEPVDPNAGKTTGELVDSLKQSMGMTPPAEAPVMQPEYTYNTNAVLKGMREKGPDAYLRGAVNNPTEMTRLPQILDAAEEAGMPEIRTVARGHLVDSLLNSASAENPREALAKFREFGRQKFGENTGADLLNDVAGSNEAYHNMNKLYEAVDKSQSSTGPLQLFFKKIKGPAGAAGALFVVQKLTGTHLPVLEAAEALTGTAAAGSAIAGGAYRVMEIGADNIGSFLGRKRSSFWDAVLDGVEGAGRMTPAVMNAHLAELRRKAASTQIMNQQQLEELKSGELEDAFKQ